MHFCSKEKETGAILFLEVRNWPYIDLRIRKLVLYCFQRKELVLYLLIWRKNWCNTVLREGNWCATVTRRRKQVLYCF